MASVGITVGRVVHADPALPPGVGRLMLYSDGPDGRSRVSITRLSGRRLATETRIGDEDVGGRTVRRGRPGPGAPPAPWPAPPRHPRGDPQTQAAAARGRGP